MCFMFPPHYILRLVMELHLCQMCPSYMTFIAITRKYNRALLYFTLSIKQTSVALRL
jgi:hypothetical protein